MLGLDGFVFHSGQLECEYLRSAPLVDPTRMDPSEQHRHALLAQGAMLGSHEQALTVLLHNVALLTQAVHELVTQPESPSHTPAIPSRSTEISKSAGGFDTVPAHVLSTSAHVLLRCREDKLCNWIIFISKVNFSTFTVSVLVCNSSHLWVRSLVLVLVYPSLEPVWNWFKGVLLQSPPGFLGLLVSKAHHITNCQDFTQRSKLINLDSA